MTTGDPEPQTEQIRELFVTGDLQQLNALLDLEAGLPTDRTFSQLKRTTLTLFGPIVRGTFACWFIHDGPHPILSTYRCATERTLIHFDPFHFSVPPNAPLQEVYNTIAASGVDPCDVLRVGLLRAIPLPHDRLRLLFAVAGFENPSRFWSLVDDLTAELDRLGFLVLPLTLAGEGLAAAPPGESSPSADEAGSLESTHSGWLADQASGGDQVAAGHDRPWLQIPDHGWDRRALELWCRGYTIPEIAVRLDRCPQTVRNRLTTLRTTHPDYVPMAAQLRKLNIR